MDYVTHLFVKPLEVKMFVILVEKIRILDLLTSYNSKNSSSEMSPSSKLVSNNWRTFLKVVIALVFISKLQQEKAATTTRRPASFLNAIFRAIATATWPQAPSTKSAVVESRRRRILSSLLKNAAASDQGELHNGPWERLALTQRTLGKRFFPRLSHDT